MTFRSIPVHVFALALLLAGGGSAVEISAPVSSVPVAPAGPKSFPSMLEAQALHDAWVKADYRFCTEVRTAYLAFAKAQAKTELEAANQTLPANFLKWVDSDPNVEATVYGVRRMPANVLRVLHSLDLDLGEVA